jgi:hypothetical protein
MTSEQYFVFMYYFYSADVDVWIWEDTLEPIVKCELVYKYSETSILHFLRDLLKQM